MCAEHKRWLALGPLVATDADRTCQVTQPQRSRSDKVCGSKYNYALALAVNTVMTRLCQSLQGAAGAMRSLLQTMLPEHIGGLDLPGHSAAGLGAAPEGSLCNGKCRAQVFALEALVLAVIIISSVSTGVCMMNILNTPSRFETPKEATRHAD